MSNWWDSLIAPFARVGVSGYDFGAPMPAGGWTGTGQSFGWLKHLGTDFGTTAGEAIAAPGAGTVKYSTGVPGFGNVIVETLDSGYQFVFGHVAAGISGRVKQGQRIGTTGQNIGSSKGAVTLVQVLTPKGVPINPDPILTALFGSPSTITMSSTSSAPASDPCAGKTGLAAAWCQLTQFPGNVAATANPLASVQGALGVIAAKAALAFWVMVGLALVALGLLLVFFGDLEKGIGQIAPVAGDVAAPEIAIPAQAAARAGAA